MSCFPCLRSRHAENLSRKVANNPGELRIPFSFELDLWIWFSSESYNFWICISYTLSAEFLRGNRKEGLTYVFSSGHCYVNSTRNIWLWEVINGLTNQQGIKFLLCCWSSPCQIAMIFTDSSRLRGSSLQLYDLGSNLVVVKSHWCSIQLVLEHLLYTDMSMLAVKA